MATGFSNWYYNLGNERFGPFTEPEFLTVVLSGKIQASTRVWYKGAPGWMSFSDSPLAEKKTKQTESAEQPATQLVNSGSTVFCRGCGKQLHEAAAMCPACGFVQIAKKGNPAISSLDRIEFVDAIKLAFTKYAIFRGVATREEYWYFSLFLFYLCIPVSMVWDLIVITSLGLQSTALLAFFSIVLFIATCGIAVPSLSVAARRLHDVGRSGWWLLLNLTFFGGFVILFWLSQPRKLGENQFVD